MFFSIPRLFKGELQINQTKMKTQIVLLVGLAGAKITDGQCGEGPATIQNVDAKRLTGDWYPFQGDRSSLDEYGFDGSCFKQKVGLPEDFKWITEDSEGSSSSDEEPEMKEGESGESTPHEEGSGAEGTGEESMPEERAGAELGGTTRLYSKVI